MTDTFPLGAIVPLAFEVKDGTDALVDPGAASLAMTLPDDSTTPVALTHYATGIYIADYPAVAVGRYVADFLATGVNAGTSSYMFLVTDSTTPVTYATAADVQVAGASIDLPPIDGGLSFAVARAADRIDEILIGAVYAVDATGTPTEAAVIDTLKRATVAQALWALDGNDETGQAAALQSSTIGRVSWTRKANAGRVGVTYAPDAVTILRTAGLLPTAVRRWPS